MASVGNAVISMEISVQLSCNARFTKRNAFNAGLAKR